MQRSHFNYRSIVLIIAAFFLVFGCAKEKPGLSYEYNKETGAAVPYPNVSFAVISDLHIYDPSLGSSGEAFEEALNSDRKLLLDSIDLVDYGLREVLASDSRFLIISGDLTKDGELINHQLIAEKLKRVSNGGIAVYVVPGNHDINNPDAVKYSGKNTSPVPSVNADDYAAIYGDFGFKKAIMRDDDSLSYVAEPVNGLWLLCLDACRYRENMPGKKEIVSGQISQKTADWITLVLKAAITRNKAVIAVMHHGIVEHWKGQSKLHPDYLISDYENFGKFLASYNVRLAFTGHYHAQDITLARFGDKFIYDIETGSLVTAPCPIRFLRIRNNAVQIRSETVVDKIHPNTDFAEKGYAFVKKTVALEAFKTLKKYMVSDKGAAYISDAVGDAFFTHYNGDEDQTLRPAFEKSRLGLWGRFVYGQQKYVLDGLWADLQPEDNNVRLEL